MRQATSVYDWDSIFKYLNIAPCDIPNGAKGKRKMKKLFRSVGRGIAYHEGVRAKKLIEALNFEVIIEKAPLNFSKIDRSALADVKEKLRMSLTFMASEVKLILKKYL